MSPIVDRWGEPLATRHRDAMELFSDGVEALAGLMGDVFNFANLAISIDETFTLSLCLQAYLVLYTMTGEAMRTAGQLLERIDGLGEVPDKRTQLHVKALRYWSCGDFASALVTLEDLLKICPRDLLAAKVAQDLCLFVGDTVGLHDVAIQALGQWDRNLPRYDLLMGMHSFGLEENYEYSLADVLGRDALEMNAYNVYARHSVGHVYEMVGSKREGLKYFLSCEENWSMSSSAVHMWWHLSLLYLDNGQDEEVLSLYDRKLCGRVPATMHDITDRASLLWRLHLLGHSNDGRIKDLVEEAESFVGDSVYVFNELHLVLVYLLAGDVMGAERVILFMSKRSCDGYDGRLLNEVGIPIANALVDFAQGHYERAAVSLCSLKYRVVEIGGSHAQRDFVQETALVAAAAAKDENLVLALSHERNLARPDTESTTNRLVSSGRAKARE